MTKQCGRPIAGTRDGPCWYPRAKGKQRCVWHWLMAQSSDVQAEYASNRHKANVVGPDQEIARVPSSEWPEGERWCAGCQSFVPLFYCSGSRCKACASSAAHARRLESNYGISPEEYQRIFQIQGGRCAICRNRPRSIRFAVDHDHQTGQNRGILCKRCNHDLLGGAHDSVELLWRALTYLLFPPASRTGRTPSTSDVVEALQTRLELVGRLSRTKYVEPQPPPF